MQYGLIGEKLGHSFSPEIHGRIASYTYELQEIPQGWLGAFMLGRDFRAINVTIPYKTEVIPYLDEVDPRAARIGAVNTVVNRGGRLIGYNTDYDGMAYLVRSIGLCVEGEKVLILGSGGTSLTAYALMTDLGAREVLRVSRTAREVGTVTYEEVYASHTDAAVIINTTPVGMYPKPDGTPIDMDHFPRLIGVLDAVYNPLRTTLVTHAAARGIPAAGGLGMLVAQAVRASEHFTGDSYPDSRIDEILSDMTREKEHIILIGMPASGKSTVGRLVAAETGRTFVDIDEEIVATAGCDIPTIFRERGESAFRDLEAEVLARVLFTRTGCVVATGGGAPLRAENVRAMHRTGQVYWLDRPLELLTPTADRPTASDREALAARYRERYEIYRAAADVHICGAGAAEEVAQRLMKERET